MKKIINRRQPLVQQMDYELEHGMFEHFLAHQTGKAFYVI